ncbi:MAG: helix-hairpin-helix domain-containing protein [Lentisphaerales bacterium]|nr:helix-hairpin-helix domain-containing protein [Lentisphaerales bacterium]
MGFFDLFKKKGEKAPDLSNQMLEMKKRSEPVKLKNTNQKEAPTKSPTPATEPSPVNLKHNIEAESTTAPKPPSAPTPSKKTITQLQTTTTEKKHLDQLPSVKKLVIPAHDQTNSKLVQPTDTVTGSKPKELTQVSLSQTKSGNETSSLAPPGVSISPAGEGLNIPLSLLIGHIPEQFLVPGATEAVTSSETIRFGKEELLPILSQGVFAVVGGALLQRLPEKLLINKTDQIKEVFNIPLDGILPLIPPEWFILQNQDNSLTESLNDMTNPFADAFAPEPEESNITEDIPKPAEQAAHAQDDTEEEEIALNIEEEHEDPLTTQVQEAPKVNVSRFDESQDIQDPRETAVQLTPPPRLNKFTQEAQNEMDLLSQTSSDKILIIPAKRLAQIIRNPHVTFNLPKSKAIECLKSGSFIFSRKEICKYGGISDNSIMSNDEQIDLGLVNILDLIPAEWMTIQDQDTKHTDSLEKMNNVFGSAFEEEKSQAHEDLEKTEVELEIETANSTIQKQDTPPPKDSPDSLITGGFLGNTSPLFDDDEDLELDIDDEEDDSEEVALDIQEETEEITLDIKEETEEVALGIQEESEKSERKSHSTAYQKPARPSLEGKIPKAKETSTRPSTAPNGIDINRSNLKDLCQLHSAGEKLAQTIISYRQEHGDFQRVNNLLNVPGVGTSVYRSLTGLRPSADLEAAERRLNKLVDLDIEKDYPLGKLLKAAQKKFKFKSLILSEKDGFEICSTGDTSLLESNSELLAAATPQLFKKTKHFLKQANLPHPQLFTFYLEDTPVTFGIADEVFLTMVHKGSYPDAKHMKICRQLINEIAWYCSFRAVV